MTTFRIKPREVRAIEFDGTEASAKRIMDHFYPAVRPGYDRDGRFDGTMTLTRGFARDTEIKAGYWLVQDAPDVILAFDAEGFARSFERVIG